MSVPHLAVVVPAYNEESRLERSLLRICEYLSTQQYTWSVVVVSDGSTDGTTSIVRNISKREPRVQLIEYMPNRGKGYAVRKGMLESEGEWLLLSDADLAAPIEEIEKLFA